MSAILGQISVAIGGLFFVISLIMMVGCGVPILTAVFRGSVVMCVVSTAVAVFFRFFSSVLRQFVAEQIVKRSAENANGAQKKRQPGGGLPARVEK